MLDVILEDVVLELVVPATLDEVFDVDEDVFETMLDVVELVKPDVVVETLDDVETLDEVVLSIKVELVVRVVDAPF